MNGLKEQKETETPEWRVSVSSVFSAFKGRMVIRLQTVPKDGCSQMRSVGQALFGRGGQTVEAVIAIHKAQLLSYRKLLDIPLGLINNFHSPKLTDGVSRLILPGANLD